MHSRIPVKLITISLVAFSMVTLNTFAQKEFITGDEKVSDLLDSIKEGNEAGKNRAVYEKLKEYTLPEVLGLLRSSKVGLTRALKQYGRRIDERTSQKLTAKATQGGFLFSLALLGAGMNRGALEVETETKELLKDRVIYEIALLKNYKNLQRALNEYDRISEQREVLDIYKWEPFFRKILRNYFEGSKAFDEIIVPYQNLLSTLIDYMEEQDLESLTPWQHKNYEKIYGWAKKTKIIASVTQIDIHGVKTFQSYTRKELNGKLNPNYKGEYNKSSELLFFVDQHDRVIFKTSGYHSLRKSSHKPYCAYAREGAQFQFVFYCKEISRNKYLYLFKGVIDNFNSTSQSKISHNYRVFSYVY